MNIFLICPVRGLRKKQRIAIAAYVISLEKLGREVYWPWRDTDQNDLVGLRICTDNLRAIRRADEVHIWYNPKSQGSVFDFGIAFGLRKKIVLANPDMVLPTENKSFANVLIALHKLNTIS